MMLAPSILSFDLGKSSEFMPALEAAGADVIHMDVMDGQFVPPISFGDSIIQSLRPLVATPFEAHLMTLTPERHFEAFAKAGCSRIIFHAEATPHAHRFVQQLHQMGLQAGVSINPGTSAETLMPLLEILDLALVMTVNPGWGGQSFLSEMLDKVAFLRAARPDLLIEVDGGIDPTTIRSAADAGANVFVVGSYLAKAPDLSAAVGALRAACA